MSRATAPFLERERRDGDERHGTPSGAQRHSRRGELPCDACRAAQSEYNKRRLSADDNTRRNRLHAKAQRKAYQTLAKAHPDEYRALYLAFKEQFLGEVVES